MALPLRGKRLILDQRLSRRRAWSVVGRVLALILVFGLIIASRGAALVGASVGISVLLIVGFDRYARNKLGSLVGPGDLWAGRASAAAIRGRKHPGRVDRPPARGILGPAQAQGIVVLERHGLRFHEFDFTLRAGWFMHWTEVEEVKVGTGRLFGCVEVAASFNRGVRLGGRFTEDVVHAVRSLGPTESHQDLSFR